MSSFSFQRKKERIDFAYCNVANALQPPFRTVSRSTSKIRHCKTNKPIPIQLLFVNQQKHSYKNINRIQSQHANSMLEMKQKHLQKYSGNHLMPLHTKSRLHRRHHDHLHQTSHDGDEMPTPRQSFVDRRCASDNFAHGPSCDLASRLT